MGIISGQWTPAQSLSVLLQLPGLHAHCQRAGGVSPAEQAGHPHQQRGRDLDPGVRAQDIHIPNRQGVHGMPIMRRYSPEYCALKLAVSINPLTR